MNTPDTSPVQRAKQHPMLIAAAIAIIVFCLAGTAAIFGWLPSSIGSGGNSGELTASDRAALASSLNADDRAADTSGANAERERAADLERDQERERERVARLDRERAAAARDREPVRLAAAAPARKWCGNCGNVESVREVTQRAQGSGLGAAGGAVIGGLLGNQVGGGNGRKLATVAERGRRRRGRQSGRRQYESDAFVGNPGPPRRRQRPHLPAQQPRRLQ
ncbi:hypothetical protein LP420_05790 [Massilia sp. B-10]|nr:hypothetical protein LP420_05790 [Massilia sp. B-10]